jgi:hypothetical protein
MSDVYLYVEGGTGKSKNLNSKHNSKELNRRCENSFSRFVQEAGLKNMMPRIVACGSRYEAFDKYKMRKSIGDKAFLLIDSEAPIEENQPDDIHKWKPWKHFQNRDTDKSWDIPDNARDTDCHLMVQLMESWFFADKDALKSYYGQKFHENSLPQRKDIENIPKEEVLKSFKNATKDTSKGVYGKGGHSFDILQRIDPEKVTAASPWAKRFVDIMNEEMTKQFSK